MDTAQNNNEFLEGESNSRENFENKWNYPSERPEFWNDMMNEREWRVANSIVERIKNKKECKKD